MKEFICRTCIGRFQSKKADKNREPKYCSRECYAQSLIKPKKERVRKPRPKTFSAEARRNMSEGRKQSEKCKGPNLYNWRGGKATELVRMKESFYRRKRALKLPIDTNYLRCILDVQQNECFFCESDLSEYKAIEHLTPVSRGGDNQPYNLVYCCKSCNSKKRQNTLEEYATKNDRFDWLDKFDTVYAEAVYRLEKAKT